MTRTILMKYGELILKGANKRSFEKLLCDKIKARMRRLMGDAFHFECMQSTLYVTPDDDAMVEEAYSELKKVFGIVSLCISYRAEKNMDDIIKVACENIPDHIRPYRSFKVDARRSDKQFPLTSPQIMAQVGGELSELCPEVRVDVVNPEIVVRVEIRENYAYIHAGSEHGAGGMPYLSNGRGLLLLSGGIDSPVAGYMMAKRGVEIEAVHFESFPYTSERAKEKLIFQKIETPIPENEKPDISPEYIRSLVYLFVFSMVVAGLLFGGMSLPTVNTTGGLYGVIAGGLCVLSAGGIYLVYSQSKAKKALSKK